MLHGISVAIQGMECSTPSSDMELFCLKSVPTLFISSTHRQGVTQFQLLAGGGAAPEVRWDGCSQETHAGFKTQAEFCKCFLRKEMHFMHLWELGIFKESNINVICETNIWWPDWEHFHSEASLFNGWRKPGNTPQDLDTWGFDPMTCALLSYHLLPLAPLCRSTPRYVISKLRKWHHTWSIFVRFIFQLSQQSKCWCEKKRQKKTNFCWLWQFGQTMKFNKMLKPKTEGHRGVIILNSSKCLQFKDLFYEVVCQISEPSLL